MKTLKKYINKIKDIIIALFDWIMGVIMNMKQEQQYEIVAVTNRKYDFYEFLISNFINGTKDFINGTKDGIKSILNNKRIMLALSISIIGIGVGGITYVIYNPKEGI